MLIKYVKSRRKCRLICLFTLLLLIILTIVIIKTNNPYERIIDEGFIEAVDTKLKIQETIAVVPETYNEHKIKTRLIKDKIKYLTQKDINNINNKDGDNDSKQKLETNTPHVHIFYSVPVIWYKKTKTRRQSLSENGTVITQKSSKVLNTSFYPALGLYQPTKKILQKHFQNIKNCGIGVIILTLNPKLNGHLIDLILNLAPNYNLTVTFEITVPSNRSVEYFTEQLKAVNKFTHSTGLYRVFSITKNAHVPLIYVSNAYKLSSHDKILCDSHEEEFNKEITDAVFIGHIRLKNHAEIVRRLCFDGFYTKSPSNGAVFASTWKNWSYLKSFAMTYKMLFVPTVGPGFAERNKFPRHGDIQRHRSNGRYYGVGWRTAILNHVGFINVASYNNWQDGSQIEEAIPKAGFMDYNPGSIMKYLDLTTHWVGNFLKSEKQSQHNCNDFFNNTIC